jgi:hypothetical protein
LSDSGAKWRHRRKRRIGIFGGYGSGMNSEHENHFEKVHSRDDRALIPSKQLDPQDRYHLNDPGTAADTPKEVNSSLYV